MSVDAAFLVFGGPYSNLQALDALLAEGERLGIPPQRMICTGDVVAYGADPVCVTERMMGAGIPTIMGNCEENLAAGADDCGCGFAEGTTCDLLARGWYAHANRHLGSRHRSWMAGLPRRLVLEIGGRRLAVVHGGAMSINRFLFASDAAGVFADEIAATGCHGVIAGHCGLPFTRVVGDALWHNAGAIGMPANDGTPRVWFSLLTPVDGGLRIERRALSYDHGSAAAAMRAAGLAEGYASALETGLWPSLDVLPAPEREATGTALNVAPVTWSIPGRQK
ncbi:metallophosphoesterase family protein [Plastoroseomonas arctica]|uniref:Metallophosphoesterase family protein n=1 Tax=Plastoroseomonas arctica TaxID=1509237 RepID=A0AAF1JZI6_9PROT|nr:metallophosphoesterase family protein [Plastoroseomonas arctica]MBR0656815.1 metallophosphoesterase family protein [Plastoroseomonas arctica]